MSGEPDESIPPPPSDFGTASNVAPVPPAPIVKVLVSALLVIVVVGGLGIWWMSHRGAEARLTCERFIRAAAAGDLAGAEALCTSDVDVDTLSREVTRAKGWGGVRNLSLSAVNRPGGAEGVVNAEVAGEIDFANVTHAFLATLVQQRDGSYRIIAYHFE